MPIGSYMAIPTFATELIRQNPGTVLDLGMGFGMLGVAVRQWLDLGVQPWRTHLVGVEIWPAYRNPVWDLYNLIFVRDLREHLKLDRQQYAMVLIGDVIEHFEDEVAIEVLEQARRLVCPNGSLMVITPDDAMEQGAAHGNPYERHRSVWTSDRFVERGFEILIDSKTPQLPPATPTVVARWTNA
ncbi:methyltransferase domain-containing protein [Roseiconus lacunae]|uniref:Methyltransferase domain-containing protein n=2 Tax=Roseiconus lacunae TaxID=2605694 RepID=A0ABT7PHN3_9BACT|nr:methyltransferase domain-containing protein [Roseiconus lacunae]MCD0461174.1 class I SAM-dependent methyltransferase [Roseiconus lacunae]MDM4016000.1 methyltransferase domain-containing protein [Roseiconus lacunae]